MMKSRLALLAIAVGHSVTSCTPTEDDLGPPVREPDIASEAVSARFGVSLEPTAFSSLGDSLEPKFDTLKVEGASERMRVRTALKRLPARPGFFELDLFVENTSRVTLRDVSLAGNGAVPFADLSDDPFVAIGESRPVPLGSLGPEGLGRARLLVAAPTQPSSLEITLAAATTKRVATSSSTLAVAPDGEVWATVPDADAVAVIDSATDSRVALVAVEGRPSSAAMTPDGQFVLVTSTAANRVSVIERSSRKVVQSLGEADGIGREPRHVVVAPDGGHAFVSAYVDDTITSLQRRRSGFSVEKVTRVGRRPAGMAIGPDGQTLLVAHFLPRGPVVQNEGWVTALRTEPLEVAQEIGLEDPFNTDKAACLGKVFGVSASRVSTEAVPTQLAGVFLDPGGRTGWVPGTRVPGAIIVWERGPKSEDLGLFGSAKTAELAAPFLFLLDARRSASVRPDPFLGVLDPPDVNLEYVTCAKLPHAIEMISRDLIPSAPGEQVNRGAAFPSGTTALTDLGIPRAVAFSRGGRRALVLSFMSDELAVIDAVTEHATTQRHFALGGSNPTGLVTTPDGRKAYVTYENSLFASVVDLSAYADTLPPPSFVPYVFRDVPDFSSAPGALTRKRVVRRITDVPERPPLRELTSIPLVDSDPLPPQLRRGKVLFSSANPEKLPTLTASRLGGCATCHPGGGNDGTLWGTMEGERRTLSLYGGVAGRGWLHASGTHQNIDEFVRTVSRERLGATLSEEDVAALATYVAKGVPALQRPQVNAQLAETGRGLFEKHCASCHEGALGTSGNPDPADPFGGGKPEGPRLYDVGTGTDDAHVLLGNYFESIFPAADAEVLRTLRGDRDLGPDDPLGRKLDFRPRPVRARGKVKAASLIDVWDNTLFMHAGNFATLADAVAYMNTFIGAPIASNDLPAVVEYLKSR